MILPKKRQCGDSEKKHDIYQELVNYLNENNHGKFFLCILNNLGKFKIDEKMFFFIYRQTKPFLAKYYDIYPKKNVCFDLLPLKVLSRVISQSKIDFNIFLQYMTVSKITNIFENLKSENDNVFGVSKLLIETISNKFSQSSSIFLDIIANDLISFLMYKRHSKVIEFEFGLLKSIIVNNGVDQNFCIYYKQYILPIIISIPYAEIDLVVSLLDSICSRASNCQKYTLEYFVRSFLKFDSNDQIKIIELTICVLKCTFFKEISDHINLEFSEILNLALSRENYLVVDAALEMLNDMPVKRYIEIHRKFILPYTFETLYRLSKKFWKKEQKCKAIQTIGEILNLDIDLFEECLVTYNKKSFYKKSEDPSLENEKLYNDIIRKAYNRFDG